MTFYPGSIDRINIDVIHSGAVVLGPEVTCDGFHCERSIRVQTHAHTDHLGDFSTSLGACEVVMSPATLRILSQQYPALEVRENVHRISPGETWTFGSSAVTLLSSNHMLGAVQVQVRTAAGYTVGYSGDFGWPLSEVISVDGLVLDATYGSPDSDRRYSQSQAQEEFVRLVQRKSREGPVHILAHTGPAERGLHMLAIAEAAANVPVVVSARLAHTAKVCRDFGLDMPDVITEGTTECHGAISSGRYIRFWGLDSDPMNDGFYKGVALKLTKYRVTGEPIAQLGERHYQVGFSNHASFHETLDYVHATGARLVVTDGIRGGDRARTLAQQIHTELGVIARVSSNHESHFWGK